MRPKLRFGFVSASVFADYCIRALPGKFSILCRFHRFESADIRFGIQNSVRTAQSVAGAFGTCMQIVVTVSDRLCVLGATADS